MSKNEDVDSGQAPVANTVSRTGDQPDTGPKAPVASDAGRHDLPVVGIGASAGGIGATEAFLAALPANPGMAFVVVQHLDPSHHSELPSVLSIRSTLPVEAIVDGVHVEPNRVYVVPPNHALTIEERRLHLHAFDAQRGQRTTIDNFLKSLAADCDVNSVGVIVSGAGSDGASGMRAIKARGGLTMVQDPVEAEYASMPASAIDAAAVDIILPAAELATRLVSIVQAEGRMESDEGHTGPDGNALRGILSRLQTLTGHDFSRYKRPSLLRRIGRRVAVAKCSSLTEYHRYLRGHPAEATALMRELLITVTDFFRDPESFDALADRVIPSLFEGKSERDAVRVWVAGCASGEEAYTLAMLLHEYAATLERQVPIKIFATDIEETAIEAARAGVYSAVALQNVPVEYRERYFQAENGDFRISKELRDLVLFARHNVLQDPPFANLDLVSCRNLLIYLNADAQRTAFEVFHYALGDDGYLFLGASESPDASAGLFTTFDRGARIFRTNPSKPRHLPVSELSIHSFEGMPERMRRELPAAPEFSYARLHQQLLVARYAPASLLVDQGYRVLHVSTRASAYLKVPEGEPSYNVLDLVDPELRPTLRAALFQVLGKGETPDVQRVRLSGPPGRLIDLRVRPVVGADTTQRLAQVVFEDVASVAPARPKSVEGAKLEPLVERLEEELDHARAQLKATVEEYETATEELRASNEELLSMNEELQSTAEELETSKEELQSMNEELSTVNQELNSKVQELDEVNSDLKNLLSSTNIGTLFLDRGLRLKRYTKPATELFNLIPSDVGRPIAHVTHMLDYQGLADDAAQVLSDLTPVERETRSEDGHWFIVRLRPYRTMRDQIDGVVVTFVDITQRRAEEQAVIEARDAADRLAQLRAAFLANISHEIRTPLTSIIGLSQVLGEKLDERNQEMARLIHRSGQRLLQTLDSVLDLSQIESGELRPKFEQVDVVAHVNDSVDMMRPMATDKGLDLRFEPHQDAFVTVTDPGFFSRIVDNLLSNAIKFTKQGHIQVDLRCEPMLCVLEVADTGIGIGEDFLPQLFDKFKQADTGTSKIYQGSGLGLSLVRELVGLLGGSITVDSIKGQGTTFRVELPNRTHAATR